ncbi:hypothetical protein PFISCL1PPCAC_11400 [Pristionchus fissidentatus]|uniref:G protein-coupled receptor n=1 Tax=Pristionchus fissidentatus TaxID=1538716 RepID=A0AAV5VL39_9BILA|nr:hypothetical protein PFISCL1PPCAC_11400 [Pristionchus fissidentatus]
MYSNLSVLRSINILLLHSTLQLDRSLLRNSRDARDRDVTKIIAFDVAGPLASIVSNVFLEIRMIGKIAHPSQTRCFDEISPSLHFSIIDEYTNWNYLTSCTAIYRLHKCTE